jgi:predicted GH43/DUF377 family glycosyl hydrolase
MRQIQVASWLLAMLSAAVCAGQAPPERLIAVPRMHYTDTDRGQQLAKDPDVVRFGDRYLMYYSISRPGEGFAVGIATSADLDRWIKAGELLPGGDYEKRGLAAPAAIVLDGRVHLFYQTYGNGRNDAICHATSEDGIHFVRNPANPIFRPSGDWNCGRAIDADVIAHGDRLFLYCATRDPEMKVQMLAGATAPLGSDYSPRQWTQIGDGPLLAPELPWELRCIEAPAVCRYRDRFYMFYAGGYNNEPQQIGCAVSDDGIRWQRLSDRPLLPNGQPGEWNSSESGHPGVFVDRDGQMHLFFQGNNDRGRSWYLSRIAVRWADDRPYLLRREDGHEFR